MNRLPPIIGIAGKAGVGKDTLAAHLVARHGYTRYGFADPLKRLLNERFGWRDKDWEYRDFKEHKCPLWGSHATGEDFSPRSWAQWLGTEVGRNTFGEDCWVEAAAIMMDKEENRDKRWVISDVRFENEAKWIRSSGGLIIHLAREGVSGVTPHVSEAGIAANENDYLIRNDSTISHLHVMCDMVLKGL